jgi:hypothetical protein
MKINIFKLLMSVSCVLLTAFSIIKFNHLEINATITNFVFLVAFISFLFSICLGLYFFFNSLSSQVMKLLKHKVALFLLVISFASCSKNDSFSDSLENEKSLKIEEKYGLRRINADTVKNMKYMRKFSSTAELEAYLSTSRKHLRDTIFKNSLLRMSSDDGIEDEGPASINNDGIFSPLLFTFPNFANFLLPNMLQVYLASPYTSVLINNGSTFGTWNYNHGSGSSFSGYQWVYLGVYREIYGAIFTYDKFWDFKATVSKDAMGYTCIATYTPIL